jgi:dolichol-phosphate mannosyltransferase
LSHEPAVGSRAPHRDFSPSRHARARVDVTVVIPLHNEEPSLASLYGELRASLDPTGATWEALFVDDGSTDGSFAALTALHAEHANVRVARLRRNFGKSAALAVGFEHARGKTVITLDSDGQDDPAEIPRLLAKLREGFDIVSGWKGDRKDPLSRRLPSRIFNTAVSRCSGLRLHDFNCGLKAYRSEVVKQLRLYGELHRFVPVLAYQRGFRVGELRVNHRPRLHGRSRFGLERYLRGAFDLATVCFIGRYRQRPLHLFGGLGLLLSFLGLGFLAYLTVLKFAGHAIGQRPLLTLGVLFVVVGMQFFSLGLVSELITRQSEDRVAKRERVDRYVAERLS